MIGRRIFIGAVLRLAMLLGALVLGACSSSGTPTIPAATKPIEKTTIMTPSPTQPVAATPTATAIRADIVLTDAQNQIPTTVKVGQIINVLDSPGYEWSVDYRDLVLVALTPPDKMTKPGPAGWFFRALAPGHTAIMLESKPPPCPPGTTCPPAIVRLVFPIQVIP